MIASGGERLIDWYLMTEVIDNAVVIVMSRSTVS